MNLGGRWKKEWDEYIFDLSHGGITLKDSIDSLRLMHNHINGNVSTTLSYDLIVSAHVSLSINKALLKIWEYNIPLKIKCFMCLLLKNHINTWDTLQSKGWREPSHYCFCLNAEGTINHLLLTCSFVLSLLNQLKHFLLFYHSNLGTKHKSHQRLITITHENGVIRLQNE